MLCLIQHVSGLIRKQTYSHLHKYERINNIQQEKQPQGTDNPYPETKWALNVQVRNLVLTVFTWPRGSGPLQDMIFSTTAGSGCVLTTMALLREAVNILTPAVNSLSTWWWIAEAQKRGLLLFLLLPAQTVRRFKLACHSFTAVQVDPEHTDTFTVALLSDFNSTDSTTILLLSQKY